MDGKKLALELLNWIVYFINLGWKIPSFDDIIIPYWLPVVFFVALLAWARRIMLHKKR